MKPVIAWVKKNWLIVVFVALIVTSLPAAWFFSNKWNKSIQAEQQKAATDQLNRVNSTKVKYTLPQYEPGGTEISKNVEPTSAMTAWFTEQKAALAKQAGQVADRAVAFNRGTGDDAAALGRREHRPLVEGVFPGDALKDDEVSDRLYQLERVFIPTNPGTKSIYQQLLDDVGAGAPADPVMLSESLKDLNTREQEKITANKRELTDDEKAGVAKILRERRVAAYRTKAQEVHVFGTMDVFNHNAKNGSVIPDAVQVKLVLDKDTKAAQLVKFFVWQWDYWVMKDVFAAIRVANTDASGRHLSVIDAPIKRIVKLTVLDPEGLYGSAEADPLTGAAPAEPTAAVPGMAPLNKSLSITGRGMGKWNPIYDVRRATLEVIVSSARINDVIDAVQRTNFMTVTGVDLEAATTESELSQGYDYGGEHVVKATLEIESVWLRSWMGEQMPKLLRGALGIPEAAPATGG